MATSGRSIGLLIRREGHPDRNLRLGVGVLQIGRADDNGLVLPDIAVSRRHARLQVTDGEVVIEDVGSGNGTYLRGKPIKRHPVLDRDEVLIDPFVLTFSISAPARAEPAPPKPAPPKPAPPKPAPPKPAPPKLAAAGQQGVRQHPRKPPTTSSKQDGSALPCLEVLAGDGIQPSYVVVPPGISIGRSEQRDVVLMHPAASRRHAEILHLGGVWVLKDGGSVNGTFVNGTRAGDHVLADGDRLRIGPYEFRFSIPEVGDRPDGTRPFDSFMFTDPDVGQAPSVTGSTADIGPGPAPVPPLPPQPGAAPSAPPAMPPLPPARPSAGAPPAPALPPLQPPQVASPVLGFPPTVGQHPPTVGQQQPSGAPLTPVPPPLSEPPAASEGGFGTVELTVESTRKRRTRRLSTRSSEKAEGPFMARHIRKFIAVFGALAALLVLIKVMGEGEERPDALEQPALAAVSDASTRAPASTETAAAATNQAVRGLLDEGNAAFREGRYLEAVGRYAEVQKLDPDNPTARKMGYHACEFLVVKSLYEAIARRSTTMEQQRKAYETAMAAAKAALSGSGSLSEALAGLETVRAFFPQDSELEQTVRRLRGVMSSRVAAARERQVQAHAEEIGDLFSAAQRDASRGNHVSAIKGFERVLAADAERNTDYYWKAEEQIRQSKATLNATGRDAYRAGMDALRNQDYLTARARFRECLKVDPYNRGAESQLQEAQKKLDQAAQRFWQEAEVYERSNQLELAIGRYRKVLEYSQSSSSPLAQKASARIDALLR